MTDLILSEEEFQRMVRARGGRPTTDSLKIAEYFGKSHKTVLRKIASKKCSQEFTERNFVLSSYTDSSGRALPMWELTKSGFMFVAMGFTGEKADRIKEEFINAFDWMADQLANKSNSYDEQRHMLMAEFKQEKGLASLAGKTMRRWQLKKPVIEGKIIQLEKDGQQVLQLH
ncbi:Rha family transcriptional regulator [Pseudomonas fulva]|uniref:Rha family transcriptional regulator n=1 Tax=Pseudomonas fulva TaxID=47880 RepID=UPI0024810E4D|nr:Rha family transcriptional regulator [Pseudomonas fulva]